MKYTLRNYQSEAVSKILWAQKLPGNDLCVLPVGAGKSVIIAEVANRLDKPVLILQPSREILKQNHKKLSSYVNAGDIGIYSASFARRDIKKYTFATIQSIYKVPGLFRDFKMVIVDECDLVNVKAQGSMFMSFFKAIGDPKVVGLTASPYRLSPSYERKDGQLYSITAIKMINRLKERFWSRLIYNVNHEDLLKQGYLSPLEYIDKSIIKQELIPINTSGSDFDMSGFEEAISKKGKEIMEAISFAQSTSKHVLVFCSSVEQAEWFHRITEGSEVVTSDTKDKERDNIIEGFKSGTIQTVFNFGVLTMGFDHESLDCIVLLRPTRSIRLFVQMLGRGVRIAEGKKSCKVIDLTSTVKHIGRIETIKVEKVNGLWDVTTEKGAWHDRALYGHKINRFVNRFKRNLNYDEPI